MRITTVLTPAFVALLLLGSGLFSGACSSSSSNGASGDDGGADDGDPSGDEGGADAGPRPYPAFPVNGAQLVNRGGPIMATPNVVPVFYPGDASMTKVVSFLNDTSVRPAISDAVAEYGIAPMTVGTPITHATAAPSTMTDADVQKDLLADTKNYPGGPNNLYVFFLPSSSVTFSLGATNLCGAIGGYHSAVARQDGTPVIYAVIPRCAKFAYFFDFDAVTTTTVHELAEAFTDPQSTLSKPAYLVVDTDHAALGLVTSGLANVTNQENGDLCSPTSSLDVAKLGTIALPLLWSNKASAAGHNPCTGPGTHNAYFNVQAVIKSSAAVNIPGYASAELPTTLTAPTAIAHVGGSVDVQLQAFSDGPTSGPWSLVAGDDTNPQKPVLAVKLDKDKVTNGDVVTATVNVPGSAIPGTYLVAVVSKLVNEVRYTGFLVRVLN